MTNETRRRSELQHRFVAYGLAFATSMPIPEMPAADDIGSDSVDADVVIAEADFPDELRDPLASSEVHEVNAHALLLRVEGVGRYLVREGREILIDPEPTATPHDVRVYLLGTCMGALLHQRGFLVLHASGVATERGAVLFAGASGAGKSTLLAELLRRGYPMMVDDVCAVRVDGDRPIVVPSYPRTRLWQDAAERFAIDTTDLPRTRPSWDKFERQVEQQFSDREAVLTHVFHLADPQERDEFSLERLEATEAFMTLVAHTYRGMLLDGLDVRVNHFELASRVAKSIAVHRVRRPARSYRLQELADLVLGRLDDPREKENHT